VPRADDRLVDVVSGCGLEVDQDGRVSVEMRDREEPADPGSEEYFFVIEIGDPDRENRSVGWALIAEPLNVGLAERSLPGPSVTSGSAIAMRDTSSTVTIQLKANPCPGVSGGTRPPRCDAHPFG
jgi:hypothetical protein